MSQHKQRGAISWDGLGASASLACALHCAAVPLIFGLLPGVQLALAAAAPEWTGIAGMLLWSHEAERYVVTAVICFATLVLGFAYQRHRSRIPLSVAGIASVLMVIGAFGDGHAAERSHVLFQVGGGLGIALAHLLNLRALHRGLRAHATRESLLTEGVRV